MLSPKLNSASLQTLAVLWMAISVFRLFNISDKEISWDVLGYYVHLPATFIHHDPLLNDITWLEEINAEKKLTGTLYQFSSNDEGRRMYLFLMGNALFYAPSFGIAHLHANISGYETDGFSYPYQFWLVMGGLIYTLIGLWYFRKILLHYFNETISSIVLILIVVGTNYSHHLSLKNLETVNVLFMLLCILIWNTIRWQEEKRFTNMLAAGLSITLMALVKPSEIVALIIPAFWMCRNFRDLKNRLLLFKSKYKQILLTILICSIVLLPQMLYWIMLTGSPVYDTYKNPGVGLDLGSPHILNTLFSFRKGWLIYTPIMIFALIGLWHFRQQKTKESSSLLLYFVITFYIISTWSEWWYGAGFSNRPLVTTYCIAGIGLGFFILYISHKRAWIRLSFAGLSLLLITFNQFQWWQFRNYILDPYRTTKASYIASFMATSGSDEIERAKLIYRDFSGEMEFDNENEYTDKLIYTFNDIIEKKNGDTSLMILANQEFALEQKWSFRELTSTDHVWIRVKATLRWPNGNGLEPSLFAFSFDHKGTYGYRAFPIISNGSKEWQEFTIDYLSPEIRNSNDFFKVHLWHREKVALEFRDFQIISFEKITE